MKKLFYLLLFALASTAHAEIVTSNELYKSLKSDSKVEEALAVGYMLGVHDVLTGKLVCAPGLTYHVLKEVVIMELEAYPNQRNKSADAFVASALKRRWPCVTQPSKGML